MMRGLAKRGLPTRIRKPFGPNPGNRTAPQ